ncbi:FixH family protein [Wenjunlia tyrosinilytica]|uniref:Secreted protein n=1 Tax=Wenjunlia tyrosinilytica TaxID=1544741 RepID=A0A917ZIX6_9ACTN|nr:FixH family protein [Wenjunlia tyrosinilytica]GGO84002.1 hypothetical protein GCM10012280_14470 [Wenjunlia tyrosinilytica]
MLTSKPFRIIAFACALAAVFALALVVGGRHRDGAGAGGPGHSMNDPSMGGHSSGGDSSGGGQHGGHHHGGPGTTGSGAGLKASAGGYRLVPLTSSVPEGRATAFRFRVEGPDGGAVTSFVPEQTKPMHMYAVRSDQTGFQHLHPAMAADGTWSGELKGLKAGWWRVYTSSVPEAARGKGPMVLSTPFRVGGDTTVNALPAPSRTTEVDGYRLTLGGEPKAKRVAPLTLTVTRGGKPVTDLRPYLGVYAHLTAFHDGDGAFAHLHPLGKAGERGGPALRFQALFPDAGRWRLFVEFKAGGALHTAAVTVQVR